MILLNSKWLFPIMISMLKAKVLLKGLHMILTLYLERERLDTSMGPSLYNSFAKRIACIAGLAAITYMALLHNTIFWNRCGSNNVLNGNASLWLYLMAKSLKWRLSNFLLHHLEIRESQIFMLSLARFSIQFFRSGRSGRFLGSTFFNFSPSKWSGDIKYWVERGDSVTYSAVVTNHGVGQMDLTDITECGHFGSQSWISYNYL
jgi:hypothetical protein